jgi:hypothetical protein
MKSRRSLGQSMSWPIFAPGTRGAVFSDGVHLHNHSFDIPCSSVSETGFRKGVSGVPRDENVSWRKSFICGPNFLCKN